jgi:hypothetical protein
MLVVSVLARDERANPDFMIAPCRQAGIPLADGDLATWVGD